MSTENTPPRPELPPDASAAEIQADIERTRHELGETVSALAAKADVTGRAKQKISDTQVTVAQKAGHAKDVVAEKAHTAQGAARNAVTDQNGDVKSAVPITAVTVASAVVVIGVIVWRRRH